MDLFSERIFMTVNLLKRLERVKKILADGKQVFFAVGDIDSSQDKWTPVFQTIENQKNFCCFVLSNQRQFLKTMISHMGNYLTKAEKFQFRHST